MLGTGVNTATVIAGSLLGLWLGNRLPESVKSGIIKALGLVTVWIGLDMALDGTHILIIIISLVFGASAGEALQLEQRFTRLADSLKSRLHVGNDGFTTGYVTASMIFCVGPMTLVGSITEGLTGDPSILLTKAIMDGFGSIALSAAYGVGVLCAAATVLILQGGLTLLAQLIAPILEPKVIESLTAVGGLIILGLGIRLLDLTQLRVINFLPALVVIVPLALWL